MFKRIIVYRINESWMQPQAAALEEALALGRFVPCGATQPQSHGWVEPRGEDHGALVESIGGQLILGFKSETKAVPGSVVKEKLDERIARIEDETGRKPRGSHKKELKEEIVRELLPQAFSRKSVTTIWIDPRARLLVVGAGSATKGDRIAAALVETMSRTGAPMSLNLVRTNTSPAAAMSAWLSAREAPAGFTVDRECELQQPDDMRSTVRYSRHTLEIDEIAEHIRQGKAPTRLALTWEGRVSFMLTDELGIGKLEFLDVVLEDKSRNAGKDDGFDADVAIATGELTKLLPTLFDALDGEVDDAQTEGVPATAPAAANDPIGQEQQAA